MSTSTVFGIYGNSDTGKTTLIVKLVEQLVKEGYLVATIKQTKKAISIDTKRKDTWRHHGAGAELVVFSSICETDFLLNKSMSTSEIIRRITEFGCYNLILVEGADDPCIPKIQVGGGKKRENTIASYEDNFNEVLKIIKRELKMKPSLQRLRLTVNGKNIPLTEFPEQIITNTIVGMLGSLKDVQNIGEVTIQLKR
ncbi:MAG: molybdopterin-guanine dinucleotide biosynthesis protein B [Thermoplasmata archaeon]|nr:molybdopterin-guanine dinucleotide biosynthesis protein B [Thermoplasmata archaeon]MBE3136788.1 molybdopterin-guanine dinucleotide biosynthesis protein B [Thermoplasmata archaeon]MBE3139307.1 molybdopterin-guanine dinucleotide biosynthesis protein B [Thermoplasmata archaeon]